MAKSETASGGIPTQEERQLLEKICRVDGCYCESAPGYVECIAHMYGVAVRADPRLVKLKKKYEKKGARHAHEI